MVKRNGSAHWEGDLKSGKGTVSTGSGVFENQQYGFNTRFEEGNGTNPEELVAAAHASCFSMAVSAELGKDGITPDAVDTKAVIHLEQDDGGFTVTKSDLTTTVKAEGADKEAVEKAVHAAKEGCPISKLLNATITLDLTVEV